MHTGKKIKILRTVRGLTQEELGDKINKTRALVSNIEQTGKVNYHTLKTILKALDITTEEFENYDGGQKPSDYKTSDQSELMILKEKLESYQKENDLLKRLIDSQQKTIKALEEKSGK